MIDKIDNDFDHHVFLFGAALGDHQGQCDQCIIADPFRTVGVVKNTVLFHKPKEQECGDPLVAVAERMVFCNQIEQHRRFFLDARIEVFAVESLVYRPYGTLERLVFFVSEQRTAAELVA